MPDCDTIARITPLAVADSVNTLDMLVGLLLQIQAERRSSKAVTVLRFTDNMRIKECDFLFRATCAASKLIFCIGRNYLYTQLEAICNESEVAFRQLVSPNGVLYIARQVSRLTPIIEQVMVRRFINEILEQIDETTVLLRSHADIAQVSQILGEVVRKRGGRVMVCLGGCYAPRAYEPSLY